MPLAATLEQRIAAHLKIAKYRGMSDEDALAYAYAKEGIEPPVPEKSLEDHVEDLHWQLACERRRADATSARARKLLDENRALRAAVVDAAPEITRAMLEGHSCPWCGSRDADPFLGEAWHDVACLLPTVTRLTS